MSRFLFLFSVSSLLVLMCALPGCRIGREGSGGTSGGGGASAPTYTIGGTVTGLGSGNLILQNNYGDDLAIASDGSFTFQTPMNDGDYYSVTVHWSNKRCTVTNGQGRVNGADVDDVLVSCSDRSWSYPSSTSDNISPDGSSADYPKVAMDDYGNAIIAWVQSDGTYNRVYKAEYRNGAWTLPSSTAEALSPNGSHAYEPEVAMGDNGDAIIVWRQFDSTGHLAVYKAERRNGAWTIPSSMDDIMSVSGQNGDHPKVAMDDSGNAVVVWMQRDGTGDYHTRMDEYRNGAWLHSSTSGTTLSPSGTSVSWPEVAMNSRGDTIVVWQQPTTPYNQVFKSEYRSGAWTNPSSLSDNISPDGSNCYYPDPAIDDSGNIVVAWYQSNLSGHFQVFKAEYRSGSWSVPSSRNDNISVDGYHCDVPDVAMDDNGNALVAWRHYDGSLYHVYHAEYRNGSWSSPVEATASIGGNSLALRPEAAMDDNGNAIITWHFLSGSRYYLYKSEYRNGAWTNPSAASDFFNPDGPGAGYPYVAMSDDACAVITWRQSDGTNNQVFKAEYR